MKSFSLTAVAALIFIVVVSAAPPHSSSASFPKFATEQNDIDFDDLIEQLKCFRDVFSIAVIDVELKPLYKELVRKVEAHIKYDLSKCRDLEAGSGKKFNCIMISLGEILHLFSEFYVKVAQTNHGLSEKIQKDLEEKCTKRSSFFVAAPRRFLPTREQLQCMVNALGEASTKNGMANEWEEYEPKFKQHFDDWKQCDSVDSLKKLVCKIKEGAYTYGLLIKYGTLVDKHPNGEKIFDDYEWIVDQNNCDA